MQLLDLAPELVEQIVDWSMPSGFESLALTCKALYGLCSSRIKLHNLGKKWKHVAYEPAYWQVDVFRILHEISKEPLIARCIESLDLSHRHYGLYSKPDGPGPDPRKDENAILGIKQTIQGSVLRSYLEEAGIDLEVWWETLLREANSDLEDGKENLDGPFLTLSLALMLPNLKKLALPEGWGTAFPDSTHGHGEKLLPIWSLLDTLVMRANSPNHGARPFGRLESICPSLNQGYERKYGMDMAQWFIQMPSVTALYAVSCLAVDDGYTGREFHWRLPQFKSNLTRLELAYCCMDEAGISTVLSGMPSLQVFKYDHEIKWHGCLFDWNPGLFLESVAQHCGHNLTELAISANDINETENGIHSFHSFPRLKKLEFNVGVLSGPPVGSGQKRGMRGESPEGEEEWQEQELPCLATMLPSSLEELAVDFTFTMDEVALRALLENFPQERAARLPNLRKAVFRQWHVDTARSLIEGAGCELKAFDEFEHQWLREFEDAVGSIVHD
ncbi:hypothetical protein BDV95DRAFT_542282 [Massariosphaeria phaeospora]|uniref:F-box domain-containing protein n=1 Tax=Massariosphaeria phaeospora TaxID=100035 RepID=A0A7C8I732_9PLEO|nr:hypothetical protein BDV95DRAFT_542282 [Massariosphaeria phaeospora]